MQFWCLIHMLLMGMSGLTTLWSVYIKDNAVVDVKLIDMDWAGVVGTARYPSVLNMKTVFWPEGVGPGRLLQQAHDLELLQLQLNPSLRYAANSWRNMVSYSVELSEMEVDSD